MVGKVGGGRWQKKWSGWKVVGEVEWVEGGRGGVVGGRW